MMSDCQNVGSTNADIAGLGIVTAFAFQAGVSLILSIWSLLLWKSAMASFFASSRISMIPSSPFFNANDARIRRALSEIHRRHGFHWAIQKRIIDAILLTISDTQTMNGLGLVIAGLIQHKTLTLYHLHILYDTVNFTAISICASLVNIYGQDHGKKRWTRFSLLAIFIGTYLSFSILFGNRLQDWNDTLPGRCYNTRLIAVATNSHPYVDTIYLGITCLYCLILLLACIIYHWLLPRLETSDGSQPFLVTTFHKWLELQSTFLNTVLPFPWNIGLPQNIEEIAPAIVIIAMIQYPLHLYMVVGLRAANEARLSGDSENAWGFGQIVALITAFSTVLECLRGISDYYREVAKLQAEPSPIAMVEHGE
ncbi:hypothetical protein V8C37DRAFT_396903 [Trichoderma ceciliae]